MISWQNICKSYLLGNGESLQILRSVNLEIKQHEFLAMIGRSGSGKSTAMYLMGLLDHPCSGDYKFNNKLITQLSDIEKAKLRSQEMGFVFQQFMLLPHLTVGENVALPLSYNKAVKVEDYSQRVEQMLSAVSMLDFIKQMPNQLSGGQQQRVAIARALICQPSLLLADEPTGSLDFDTGAKVMRLFQKINQELGTTILMVTHDSHWSKYSSRVLTVEQGEVLG